jgi:hypothetical protein
VVAAADLPPRSVQMSSRTLSRILVLALFLGAHLLAGAEPAEAGSADGRVAVVLDEIWSRLKAPNLAESLQRLLVKDRGRGRCPDRDRDRDHNPPGHHAPGYPGPGGPGGGGDEGSGACPGGGSRR